MLFPVNDENVRCLHLSVQTLEQCRHTVSFISSFISTSNESAFCVARVHTPTCSRARTQGVRSCHHEAARGDEPRSMDPEMVRIFPRHLDGWIRNWYGCFQGSTDRNGTDIPKAVTNGCIAITRGAPWLQLSGSTRKENFSVAAPSLHLCCVVAAPSLHRHCTFAAPLLRRRYTVTAPSLRHRCSFAAPALRRRFTAAAPALRGLAV